MNAPFEAAPPDHQFLLFRLFAHLKLGPFEFLKTSYINDCKNDVFGEIYSCLPLFSCSKKALKGFKKHFKTCFFILKY
jgi:hypothetical protein